MLTFFWRAQWKIKMNKPCRALKVVKRYAKTRDSLLMNRRPNAQVRPRRKSKVTAPKAQDLRKKTKNISSRRDEGESMGYKMGDTREEEE